MSQFQVEVDKALQANLLDMVRELYLLEANGYIDQDLSITLGDKLDIELLERIVRFYCKIRFYLDKKLDTIKLFNVQESEVDFLKWFIFFFYELEAMELAEKHPNHSHYKVTKEIRELFLSDFASYKIDVKGKETVYNKVNIEIFPIVIK
jgi:hypothetical protein